MGVNPAMTATLASLFQQQPGQAPAAPGTTPPIVPPPGAPGPSAGSMQDFANLAKQQQEQLMGSSVEKEREQYTQQAQQYAGQAAQTPLPQLGPRIEKGRGFLHNLGQALQMVSLATGPGARVFGPGGPVYGPGIAQYRATQAGLMGKTQQAEKGAEEAGKGVSALASLGSRTIYGGAQLGKAQINADVIGKGITQRHQDALARIAAMTDIAGKNNAMREEVARIRSEAEIQAASIAGATREDVADIIAASGQSLLNTKIAEDPSIFGYIKNTFGLTGAQAPGGAQPVRGAAPPPRGAQKTAPAKGGKVRVRLQDGRVGTVDAGEFDAKTMTKVP